MTQPTPAEPSPSPTPDIQLQPTDVLMHLVVTLLTPFFLAATSGNIDLARLAAFETVNAFRLQNHVDLLAVAQIVGSGLASLGSLSVSMADDLPLATVLLLHGDATSLDRVAQHNRRALRNSLAETATPGQRRKIPHAEQAADPVADARYEDAVVADLAQTRQRLADAQSCLQKAAEQTQPPAATSASAPAATPTPTSAAIPAPPASATPVATPAPPASPTPVATPAPSRSPSPTAKLAPIAVPTMTDRERQTLWAAAMTEVADEFTAGLPFLPAPERKMTSRRIAALSSTANSLLCGTLPPAPQPGAREPASRHPSIHKHP